MIDRRSIPLLLIILLGMNACSGAEDSRAKALLGDSELTLAVPTSDRAIAAVGSMQAVITDPYGGPRVALPFCTGFMISRKHMLTAAHCVQREFIFNQAFVADGDGRLEFVTFGKSIRLTFSGKVDPRSEQNEASAPVFRDPAFIDKDLDLAIFDFGPNASAEHWVNLSDIKAEEFEAGELYAYPNGVPLTKTTCHNGRMLSDRQFMHDCDAMSGSSGGLLVAANEDKPIALHLAGPGANDSDHYQAHGRFESPQEFAERKGCKTSEGSGEVDQNCLWAKGYNRALPLAAVRQILDEKAPIVWANIMEHSVRTAP